MTLHELEHIIRAVAAMFRTRARADARSEVNYDAIGQYPDTGEKPRSSLSCSDESSTIYGIPERPTKSPIRYRRIKCHELLSSRPTGRSEQNPRMTENPPFRHLGPRIPLATCRTDTFGEAISAKPVEDTRRDLHLTAKNQHYRLTIRGSLAIRGQYLSATTVSSDSGLEADTRHYV